jgi:hypothetical protein
VHLFCRHQAGTATSPGAYKISAQASLQAGTATGPIEIHYVVDAKLTVLSS